MSLPPDLRHSLRVLGKAPVFTTVAILSLALGIGANTAIFTIVYALMLKALPVVEPQRLVQVSIGADQTSISNPIWEQIRDHQTVFDGALAFAPARFDLAAGGQKQYVDGIYVSGDYFRTLGVPAIAGRTIGREDDRRGGGAHGPVAVLSDDYWRDRYQRSRDAIGSTIRLDGHAFTIVGVAARGFSGLRVGARFDVAVPLATQALIRGKDNSLDQRSSWWLTIIGRLKPDLSPEQTQAGLGVMAPRIREATLPKDLYEQRHRDSYLSDPFTLLPASTGPSPLRTRFRTALFTLMGAVALVLLIACANLANLLLARAAGRRKEFAVRMALGAPRGRLVRQLLTESLLLAAGGTAVGLVFAQWASRLIVRQISATRAPIHLDLTLDASVLAFAIGAALVTAVIFGVAPAFRSTDLGANALLASGSRSIAAGWRGLGIEKLLVVVQVAFSLLLVFGAVVFVRTFASLATLDPGFDRHNVLLVSLDARAANYPAERRLAEYQRVLEAVRALPGVRSAAFVEMTLISGGSWMQRAEVPGFEALTDRQRRVHMNRISPDYFETMATPIYAGRDFDDRDALGAASVAIVNEAFARKYFNGASPIGRTFQQPERDNTRVTRTIVGLVKDSKYVNLRREIPETVFLPKWQDSEPSNYPNLVIRMAHGGADATSALTRAVTGAARGVHTDLALEFRLFESVVDDSLAQERLIAMLSTFFGGLALLVAGIGLYGVMSLAVARRRNEIGIRMALGARPGSVVRLVLRDVAIVAAIGLAIGAASGVWSGTWVRTLLFGLEPSDVTTWLIAIAALAATAGVAGFLPARRAARLDPMRALRED